MSVKGTVKKIELFGAFVDIGAEVDALVHISKLGKARVNAVGEVLNVGQEIEAWVLSVDRNARRIALTLRKPSTLEWTDIKAGNIYDGTISRVEKYGVFVDIGAERLGLVHVSELGTEYRQDPHDSLKIDESIKVKVLKVDREKRQIDLSAQTQSVDTYLDQEEDETIPTAMELALQKAQQANPEKSATTSKMSENLKVKKQAELDNIIRRTLEQRPE
jgi:ribosomal protein S1